MTNSGIDSDDQRPDLSKRAFLHRVTVTAAATAAAGLAGCQSGGDSTDEETPTPTESGDGGASSEDTPQQEDVEINLELETELYNTQSLSPVVENSESITDSIVEITGPEEEITLDSLAELEEQHITDRAGEYQITFRYRTENGQEDTIETTVTVEWLRPGELETGRWNSLMEELESPDELYNQLTEDGEFTETGREAGKTLESSTVDTETRLKMANAILGKEDGLNQYDIGALKTVINNPEVTGEFGKSPLLEELSETFLERTEAGSELTLTRLEKRIFGLGVGAELEHVEEIQQLRDQLIEDGYTQKEADYLHTVGKYDSQTINGVFPRVEQAKEHGFFQHVLEGGEIDEDFLQTVSDHTDNGLISARDPAPEQYSATPDPYASGFVKDILGDQYDPEEPLAIFMYEQTNNADSSVIPEAIEVAEGEYNDANIQTLFIEGENNVESLGDGDLDSIADRLNSQARDSTSELSIDAVKYVLFDEYNFTEDNTSWGSNTRQNCVVNTDPFELNDGYWSKQGAVNYAIMAETLDLLVDSNFGDKVDHYRESENLSDKEKKSWTTFNFGRYDPDQKKILQEEREYIMEDGLNYSADQDAQRTFMSDVESPIEGDRHPADRFRVEQ
jgi:hypothetical protein